MSVGGKEERASVGAAGGTMGRGGWGEGGRGIEHEERLGEGRASKLLNDNDPARGRHIRFRAARLRIVRWVGHCAVC